MSDDLELESRRQFVLLDGDRADGEPVGPITALGAGGIVADDGTCAPVENLAGPGQGMKMPLIEGVGLVPQTAPISVWRLGGLAIASFPFEITTQMGRRINAAVEAGAGGEVSASVIAGLTNGYLSYTSTPEEYDACHYEGSFTLFGRRQGPLLRNSAVDLLPSLFAGQPPPAGDPEPPALGLVAPNSPALEATPDAGQTVSQPAAHVRRYERATFSWRGGDPAVDAARGETFVSLQRQVGGEWRTVGTESGPEDTTEYDDSTNTWTETWQFSECDRLGVYRFRVSGRALRATDGAAEPYEVISSTFELRPTAPLEVIDSSVSGTQARVRVRYPNPGDTLLALPRRVRDGSARFSLAGGGRVPATPDAAGLAFEASVPAGASITRVSASDACGNSVG